jgi:hypothetical protein
MAESPNEGDLIIEAIGTSYILSRITNGVAVLESHLGPCSYAHAEERACIKANDLGCRAFNATGGMKPIDCETYSPMFNRRDVDG